MQDSHNKDPSCRLHEENDMTAMFNTTQVVWMLLPQLPHSWAICKQQTKRMKLAKVRVCLSLAPPVAGVIVYLFEVQFRKT
jgi:hypothetical protein